MDFSKIEWKTVVPAGLIIWFLALLANIIIGFGYSFFVGFQSRGDMEAVQAASLAFTTSILFKIIMWLILGLLTFWRARKVATAVAEAPILNVLTAGIIAMLISSIISALTPGFDLVLWLGSWLVVLGAAYVGAAMNAKQ